MRSAPVSSAACTIASPIERARMERPSTATPWPAPRAAASANEEIDDGAGSEPDRTAVAGADVRGHRRDEDRRRREGADDRRQRDVRAPHAHRERHPEGTLEIRLAEAELHDRELCRGEGD